MTTNNYNTLRELPFYDREDKEFLNATGAWVYSSPSSISDSKDLFQDIIECPDKQPEQFENNIESKYYSIKQTGSLFHKTARQHGFSIMHCNIRSLSKNITKLEDILITSKESPDIIAISETKLKESNSSNINIPGYLFLNTNSKTSAGGVGLYLAKELDFIRRCDLELSVECVESCWIEIIRKRQKNIIVGCIYRHPHNDRKHFLESLKSKLENLNSKGQEVFILGDININFLKYNIDNQTSDFLDMILSLGFLPIITKATRITDHTATLIDHIYTNVPQKVLKAGICLADISDHLPIFCTVANKLPVTDDLRYFRDFSNFNDDLFLNDIAEIDLERLANDDNVNNSMNGIASALQSITDRHAPMRKATNQKRKLIRKPWISKAILISIKRRQKLFKSHFLSSDPIKIRTYKTYNNKLNKIKEAAKTNYLRSQFNMNKKT